MDNILNKYLPIEYHDSIINEDSICSAVIDIDDTRCYVLVLDEFIVFRIDLSPIPLHYFGQFVERALEWNARAYPAVGAIAFKDHDDALIVNHAFHIKDIAYNMFSEVSRHCIEVASIWNDSLLIEFPPVLPEKLIDSNEPKSQSFFGLY